MKRARAAPCVLPGFASPAINQSMSGSPPTRPIAAPGGAVGRVLRVAAGPVPAMTAAWVAAVVLATYEQPEHFIYIALGLLGAFVAGLVGVGGAIVMFPLLLYVPPVVGQAALPPHTVAGVTMIQVVFAGLTGVLGHVHHTRVHGKIVGTLGGGTVVGALLGAILSQRISAPLLTATFATLAACAALFMFLPARLLPPERDDHHLRFNRLLAVASGFVVGVLVGIVGAGGGFLLVPLMLFLLRVPMRAAVGASLGIVLLSGLSGAVGKVVTGQVEWGIALSLVAGALPGAWTGAMISQRVHTHVLRTGLGVLIAAVALRMWWGILHP